MLFPAIGMTTAIWLLVGPLLGLESGFRADFTVAVGVAAVLLAPLSWWYRPAAIAMTALGLLLGFANLFLDAPLGALAGLAFCAVSLIVAGMAPVPISTSAPSAIQEASPAAPGPRAEAASLCPTAA